MAYRRATVSYINQRHQVMTEADCRERWEVYFSGQVQGVGFRYTTRSLASRFPVVGQVRNLPDGRVELVAEGDPRILRRLVSLIETEMSGYITHTQIDPGKTTGEFDAFEIAL